MWHTVPERRKSMLRFKKISKRPKMLFRLSGLTVEQFTNLSVKLNHLWRQTEKKRLSKRERKHALGQGRKYKLSTIEDKLLLILVFYRFYLTDELMGYIFCLHPSNACRMRINPTFAIRTEKQLFLGTHRP